MHVYRPRVACQIHVPALVGDSDSTVTLDIRTRRVSLEYNDHNHADTASISAEWRDAGVDPRFLKNATCEIWLGNADESGSFTPGEKNLRFVGVMTRPRRIAREGSGFQVDLEFHDYTALFLEQKPFPTKGLPSFRDTLLDAWQKICDHTGHLDDDGETTLSSVKVLRDRIEFRGDVDPNLVIGRAVAERFARLTSVPAKANSDAWSVWQQCVGMLGLIAFIDRDRCVVTTSTEHYAPEEAPKLVWGLNILELEEETNARYSDKGVALTSFDTISGTTYEAFYPSPGDKRIRRKRVAAKKRRAAARTIESERYDFYEYHGVTDLDRLHDIARRVYEERSRQELEGRLVTAEMFADTISQQSVDLLDLRAGDNIRVEIDPLDQQTLTALESDDRRIDYLVDRGYRPEVAKLIVRNMKELGKLDPTFHAGSVNIDLETNGDSGKLRVAITFHNRIKLE